VTLLDEPVHRRAVGHLDAEHLHPRVGVRVEVDEAERTVDARAGTDVGLGDRVVAAEDDRQHARGEHLPDRLLDRSVRERRGGGQHGRVAEVDDPEFLERVDAGLEVRPGRAARGPDRARREPRPRPVRDEVVGRRADDRDVVPGELGRVLRVGRAAEAQQPGVVGLLAVLAPALERVDHGRSAARPRTASGA